MTRAYKLAQVADDRLIFRTTDHSFWFDADGSQAATLICVVQSGITHGAADILIFA